MIDEDAGFYHNEQAETVMALNEILHVKKEPRDQSSVVVCYHRLPHMIAPRYRN